MKYPHPNIPEGRAICYVRAAETSDLPEGVPPGAVYAIHDEAGNRLALVPGRDMAFAVARRNDFVPVSVH